MHVFSDSHDASKKFTNRWSGSQKYSGTTTPRGLNSMFLDCTFHMSPGETSMEILAATQEKSFKYKGHYEKDCTPNVHPQNHLHGHAERVGGCTLSDDVNFLVRDYAGRLDKGVGSSSDQIRKRRGISSSGTRRKILKGIWDHKKHGR